MWDKREINLGEIKPNTKHSVKFIYTGEEDIESVAVSCQCTTPEIDRELGVVNVTYSAGTLYPYKGETTKNVHKSIKVYFKDGSMDLLKITAKIVA